MHLYIYDSFLNQRKYEHALAQVETRLTDLGLNGKISRLGIMKNINEIIDNELKTKIKTIIAVGNDKTVNQITNSIANDSIPLGIIPIGEDDNRIAKSLGINSPQNACEILSARRIIKIDLGLANNLFFLTTASINNKETTLEISRDYSIEIMEHGQVNIINLSSPGENFPKEVKSSPNDGILELSIKTRGAKNFFVKTANLSIFPIKKLVIKNKKFPVILDGTVPIAAPVEIRVIKQKLNVIVGKNRNF